MGQLRWTNNSSAIVEWFFITPFGSVSEPLSPGNGYSHENSGDIGQIGIRCRDALIYVIDNLQNPSDVDAHLIASDVIPMKAAKA